MVKAVLSVNSGDRDGDCDCAGACDKRSGEDSVGHESIRAVVIGIVCVELICSAGARMNDLSETHSHQIETNLD